MKTLLTITRADDKHNVYGKPDDTFTVMINPEQVRHDQQLQYVKSPTPSSKAPEHKFAKVGADRVALDIVLDGTGVVLQDVEHKEVTEQLRKLRKIIYLIGSETPQPNYVRLLWGSFLFFGRTSTLNTSYTLFKPSGEPLRAKVSLAFLGSVRHDEDELDANRLNDNMVRQVQVRDGDSLPLLCAQIYGDASCYLEVASQNDLDRLEPLEPGTQLTFQPRSKP